MTKILMVCLGNICRSPLAEGILRDKAEKNNLDILVDSAGTAGYHIGDAPDPRSIEVAKKHGIDIGKLRGRKFHYSDFELFDVIYAMDSHNFSDLMAQAETDEEKNKIKLILNEIYPNTNKQVPDPYYGGAQGFEDVFQMLDKACDEIILNYKNHED